MGIRQAIHQMLAYLFLSIAKICKNRTSLLKIKSAQAYVLGVKKTRGFFLGVLFVLIALVFLINGLSLIQTALFTYSMWGNEVKFAVALILGGIEFFGAAGILIYLFKEETWGKFSGIPKVLNSVLEKRSGNADEGCSDDKDD